MDIAGCQSMRRVVLAVVMSAGMVDPLSSVPVYQQVAAIPAGEDRVW
jgi:hypothetical protein